MPNEERWRWERERGRNAPTGDFRRPRHRADYDRAAREDVGERGYGGYTGYGYGGVGAGGGYASTGQGYVDRGYGGYGAGSTAQGGGGYADHGYNRVPYGVSAEPDFDEYGPGEYDAQAYSRPDNLADPRGSYGPRDYRPYDYGGYRYTGRGYDGRD